MTEKLASFKVDNQEIKKWLPNNNVQNLEIISYLAYICNIKFPFYLLHFSSNNFLTNYSFTAKHTTVTSAVKTAVKV
jgi:hypothetical protein